ncbi:hypothetical protein EDD16DRAFT_1702669 [Pisolithus croceorrhizus]|nr:hypothetical protein EDD16DRAFT_1702669 [Pisolithus croceorrhizus]
MIFKTMVDGRWYKENPEAVSVQEEADAIYLKELDEYLKMSMLGQSSDEEI